MPSSEAPAVHGFLEKDGCEELDRYEVLEGQEFLIGRDHKTCNIIVTDLTVSNKHLQIYSIAYTEDDHQRIFVYAKDISTNGSFWRYKYNDYWREYLIGKGRAVLLSDGDKLRLCDGSSFTFRPLHRNPECSKNASTVQEDDIKLFSNVYKVTDRILGSGAYGEVRMAIDFVHKRQMACKMVKLNKSPYQRSGRVRFAEPLWREVELLKDMSHPNILHVERVFFTEENLYIISDLIAGGDLMSYIERPWTNMEDTEACIIVYQLLKALEYLHQQGICHRDLKPENVLMSTPTPGARVILADFGQSIKLSSSKQSRVRRMKTVSVGTDFYLAPEIRGSKGKTDGYTIATDMWSIGIITTLLLTGELVFEKSKDRYISSVAYLDAAEKYNLAKINHDSAWRMVNDLAKEFVKCLLVLDENTRLDVGQALKQGWFTDGERSKTIQQQYEAIVRGWMPTRPLLDFRSDLALFREASKPTLDSLLMPPPAKPRSSGLFQRPLQDGHLSSQSFLRATQDETTKIATQTGKKRELRSEDDIDTPAVFPEQDVSAKRPRNIDSQGKRDGQSETRAPAKSLAKQVGVGDHETMVQFELNQGRRKPSTELDYEERKLHDRVSREEASIFRSAKSYGKCVENRRRQKD